MKKLLGINLILTGIVAMLFLTSGTNVETFAIEYFHHFEGGVLIPEKFRVYDTDMASYYVRTCIPGTVFNCAKASCDYPYDGCPCTSIP